MDKFVITHVNAHVAKGLAHGVEEHQVAGLQIFFVYFFSGIRLFACAAGQDLTQSLFVHGSDKTTAIKALFRVVTTIVVGCAL